LNERLDLLSETGEGNTSELSRDQSMRVLIISAAYPPMQAGEATNTYYLCEHLADRGIDVQVLTSIGCEMSRSPRIDVHPIMREWSWPEMFRMRSFFRQCVPDAVLLMYIGVMYNCHPMITFAPTILKRLFPHVPFVTRYESVFVGANPSKTSVPARLFRRGMMQWAGTADVGYGSGTLLRDSDHVIALCDRHRTILLDEWPPVHRKMTLIPPPPNMRIVQNDDGAARRRGRLRLGLQEQDFVITFFGYLYKTKGIEFLLRAFRLVREARKGVKLLFIGGRVQLDVEGSADYFDRMQDLAKDLKLEDDVIWTGPVKSDGEEGSIYLHAADVAVLPFLQGVQLNNSSLSSIAAHGLPIIATRGPLLDSAFVHGHNILLSEPRDEHAIADYILQLMDNPSLVAGLKAGVRQLAEDYFSWDKAIDRTLATFDPIQACSA
jgi:glycosyltransferase involved in cell wall biosynthesis